MLHSTKITQQAREENIYFSGEKKILKFIGFANRDFLINTVIYLLFSFTKNRNDAAELIWYGHSFYSYVYRYEGSKEKR